MNNNLLIELIANLSRRVAEIERELLQYKSLGIRDHLAAGNNELNNRVGSLESQLRDVQGNIERQGVEIAELEHAVNSEVEETLYPTVEEMAEALRKFMSVWREER